MNRAAVAMIELPFDHELTTLPDGWRMTATGRGRLTAHLTTGERQIFDVAPGDWLGSSPQELYLAFARAAPLEDVAAEPRAAATS